MAEYIDIDAPIDVAVYQRNRRIQVTLRQILESNDAKYERADVRPVAWIDVNDRLPDLHDDVWEDGDEIVRYKVSDPVLCVYNGGEQTVAVYEIDNDVDFGGWVNCHDSSNLHTVTHWMELPTLPEVDNG